jgi:hypothetical protein
MVGHWPLTPAIQVRILSPEPTNCTNNKCTEVTNPLTGIQPLFGNRLTAGQQTLTLLI